MLCQTAFWGLFVYYCRPGHNFHPLAQGFILKGHSYMISHPFWKYLIPAPNAHAFYEFQQRAPYNFYIIFISPLKLEKLLIMVLMRNFQNNKAYHLALAYYPYRALHSLCQFTDNTAGWGAQGGALGERKIKKHWIKGGTLRWHVWRGCVWQSRLCGFEGRSKISWRPIRWGAGKFCHPSAR